MAHVLAFEPGRDLTRRLVGTALGHRAMRAERLHVFLRVDKAFRDTAQQAALERGVLERAMQQQIGITTDRRGEMRSDESRVGKEWCSTCRSRWAPDH